MVRNYVKKHPSRSHNQDDLKGAIQDVVENKMAIYSAAKKYGIPRTTLRRHLENPEMKKQGHSTTLTLMEEEEIVVTCQMFGEWGFGLTKGDVINVVSDYCRVMKKPNTLSSRG